MQYINQNEQRRITMKLLILATKNCNHRKILEQRLNALGVPYEVKYFEENPDLMETLQLQQSPNIIIDDQVVFKAAPGQSLPSEGELARLLN